VVRRLVAEVDDVEVAHVWQQPAKGHLRFHAGKVDAEAEVAHMSSCTADGSG
jgi:hypothetical protein